MGILDSLKSYGSSIASKSFSDVNKVGDSVDRDEEFKNLNLRGEVFECFPKNIKISSAYKSYIYIKDERRNKETYIIAICPKILSFTFKNQWGDIDPLKMSAGAWLQAGVQILGGKSGTLTREDSTIYYWKGTSPISMSLELQLFAESLSDVDSKIFKPLKKLSNLAQPTTTEGGILVPPGPAPLKSKIKFKGNKFKKIITQKANGTIEESEELDIRDGKVQITDYEITSGKGVQTDIKIGDWFYLSDILVEDVKIDIPMNLAKELRYGSGSLVTEEKRRDEAAERKKDELESERSEQEKQREAKNKDKADAEANKKTIKDLETQSVSLNKEIKEAESRRMTVQKSLAQSKAEQINIENSLKAAEEKRQNTKVAKDWAEADKLVKSEQQKLKNKSSEVNKYETENNNLTKQITSLTTQLTNINSQKTTLESKVGNIKKLDSKISSLEKEIAGINKDIKNTQTKIDNINDPDKSISEEFRTLHSGIKSDFPKPFMAKIKLDLKTKYVITQDDFNKMLSGIPNEKGTATIDLTEKGALNSLASATLDLATSFGSSKIDINGQLVERRVEKVTKK